MIDLQKLVRLHIRTAVAMLLTLGIIAFALHHSTILAQESWPSEIEGQESGNQGDGQPTYGQMRDLLRQLESSELAQRDDAENRIIQLGPTVLQFLPSVTPQTSGEMKVRLLRIRQALDRVRSEGFFEVSRVTAQGAMELAEVLEQIEQQTGNSIRLQASDESAGRTPIEVHWQDTPFWTALDELLEQTQLRLVANAAAKNELVLAPNTNKSPVKPFSAGPFRVELAGTESRQNFDSRLEGQTRVHLLITWEPRIEPLFMRLPMAGYRATTDDGRDIAPINPQASPEVRLNVGGSSARVEIQIQRPPRSVAKLESFAGQLVVSVPGERRLYQFEKFGSGARQSQKYGDLSVTLESARRNGPVFETRLFVEFGDAAGALESYRSWIMSNQAFLLDASGSRLDNVGFQTYATTNDGAGVSYLFQISGDPNTYTLFYESPSSVVPQTIDFELNGIPLP